MLFPQLAAVMVEQVVADRQVVRVKARTRASAVACPGCGEPASRVHGRVLKRVRIVRRGPGRRRKRPGRVLADKAYSSRGNRAYLRGRGIRAVIPIKKDQQANRLKRGSKSGRPPAFDARRCRFRSAPRVVNDEGAASSGLGQRTTEA